MNPLLFLSSIIIVHLPQPAPCASLDMHRLKASTDNPPAFHFHTELPKNPVPAVPYAFPAAPEQQRGVCDCHFFDKKHVQQMRVLFRQEGNAFPQLFHAG